MLRNEEYIETFIEEAKIHVETVENTLVNMDLDMIDTDEVNAIFRAVHSLKGTAGFFNLNKIVELSHCMENLFGDICSEKIQLDGEMVDILLLANDCLKVMVDDVLNSESIEIADHVKKISCFLNKDIFHSSSAKSDKISLISGSNNEFFCLEKDKHDLIADAIRHGHIFYVLKAGLNEDLIKTGNNPVQLIQTIKSIGNFVELRACVSESDSTVQDVIMEFYFSTVLQKDFLTEAINLPEENFFEIKLESCIYEDFSELDEHLNPAENEIAGPEKLEANGKPDKAISKKNKSLTVEDSLRVHVSLLNDLLNLASEMVLARNQLLRAMEKQRKHIPGIDSVLQNVDHITTELQEKVMQTRMQPISNIFSKFPRIIKDLARKLGKEIELKLEGTDVELDKSIIESIGDPLTHLIRNAVDHGVESPEDREILGKSRSGTIILKAYHEGGYVNIDVIDDGRGINIESLRNKALEKGILNNSVLAVMEDLEILQLIFEPGFSTAEKLSDLSGRGVGMDVVKTNIEKLGGTIEVFTALNRGTTFRLLLPLTLAIIPSLIVRVENHRFALPQVNLQEIVRISPGRVSRRIEYINNAEVLRLRGGLLPIVHLADVLGLPRTYLDPESNEMKTERRKTIFGYKRQISDKERLNEDSKEIFHMRDMTQTIRILVIKIGSRKLGIAVDAILGSEEILVKPLSSFIKDCKCYSGVTIMGDGNPAMILDAEGIIVKANLRFTEENREKVDVSLEEEIESMREQQDLLLFKCSGPETLAIDLSLVSRVEEIIAEDIEMVGDKEYIKFRQDSLRVIRPEDFLPIGKQKSNSSRLYVVIPKLVAHPMGIIIENIQDTIQKRITLNNETITSKGLVGSCIINNRIVLLVNIYELFEMADPNNYKTEVINKDRRATILLVEDTPFFQELEKNYLEVAGYKVLLANHGKEALQMLQENHVDAVLTDIQMPVMNGMELIKRIRADKQLAALPVMAVTSMTGESQKNAGLDAGFDLYEFKLDKLGLLNSLEQMLQERGI